MQLRDAALDCVGDTVKLAGWIIAPKVHWDYTLAMRENDLLDFMHLLADPQVAAYLARDRRLRCLTILVKRFPRFALAYLAEEMRKLGGKRAEDEEVSRCNTGQKDSAAARPSM